MLGQPSLRLEEPKLHDLSVGSAESSVHVIKDSSLIHSGLHKIVYFHSIIIANTEHWICVSHCAKHFIYIISLVLTTTQWAKYYYHLHFIDYFQIKCRPFSVSLKPPPNGLKLLLYPLFLPFQSSFLTQKPLDWCTSHEWGNCLLWPTSCLPYTTEDSFRETFSVITPCSCAYSSKHYRSIESKKWLPPPQKGNTSIRALHILQKEEYSFIIAL